MFIQPCFIQKCTPALIEKLVGLGYKIVGKTTLSLGRYGIFCNNGKIKICSTNEQPSIKDKDFIQCYDNDDLFLEFAALRDDSDYMQWFVSPKTHTKRLSGCFGQVIGMDGHYKEIVGYEWHRYENNDIALTERLNSMIQMEVEDMEFLPHKATVEEIIEHFKK